MKMYQENVEAEYISTALKATHLGAVSAAVVQPREATLGDEVYENLLELGTYEPKKT